MGAARAGGGGGGSARGPRYVTGRGARPRLRLPAEPAAPRAAPRPRAHPGPEPRGRAGDSRDPPPAPPAPRCPAGWHCRRGRGLPPGRFPARAAPAPPWARGRQAGPLLPRAPPAANTPQKREGPRSRGARAGQWAAGGGQRGRRSPAAGAVTGRAARRRQRARTALSAGRAPSPPRRHHRSRRSHLSSLLSPARGLRGVMRPRRAAAPAVSAGS